MQLCESLRLLCRGGLKLRLKNRLDIIRDGIEIGDIRGVAVALIVAGDKVFELELPPISLSQR